LAVGTGRALKRVDDVVGIEQAPVTVKLHTLPQMKGPDFAIRRVLPALGEVGLEVLWLGAAGLEADQPVVNPADDALVISGRGTVSVEGGDVARSDTHAQRGSLSEPRRRR